MAAKYTVTGAVNVSGATYTKNSGTTGAGQHTAPLTSPLILFPWANHATGTYTNCTFDGFIVFESGSVDYSSTSRVSPAEYNLTFNNCTFHGSVVGGASNITFNNCTFDGYAQGQISGLISLAGSNITFNGGSATMTYWSNIIGAEGSPPGAMGTAYTLKFSPYRAGVTDASLNNTVTGMTFSGALEECLGWDSWFFAMPAKMGYVQSSTPTTITLETGHGADSQVGQVLTIVGDNIANGRYYRITARNGDVLTVATDATTGKFNTADIVAEDDRYTISPGLIDTEWSHNTIHLNGRTAINLAYPGDNHPLGLGNNVGLSLWGNTHGNLITDNTFIADGSYNISVSAIHEISTSTPLITDRGYAGGILNPNSYNEYRRNIVTDRRKGPNGEVPTVPLVSFGAGTVCWTDETERIEDPQDYNFPLSSAKTIVVDNYFPGKSRVTNSAMVLWGNNWAEDFDTIYDGYIPYDYHAGLLYIWPEQLWPYDAVDRYPEGSSNDWYDYTYWDGGWTDETMDYNVIYGDKAGSGLVYGFVLNSDSTYTLLSATDPLYDIQTVIGGTVTDTFTNDFYVNAEKFLEFTNDFIAAERKTDTFTNDFLVYQVQTDTFDNDYLVYETKTATFSNDFLSYEVKTATFANNYLVQVTETATFDNDLLVYVTETLTFTNDYFVQSLGTALFSNDFFVFNRETATFDNDYLVYILKTSTFTNDFLVYATKTATFSNNFIAANRYTKEFTNDFAVADQVHPYAYSVNAGTLSDGDLWSLYSQDEDLFTVTESAVPNNAFDVVFTFKTTLPVHGLHLDAAYDGNIAHIIKLYQWKYTTSEWVAVTTNTRDIPNTNGVMADYFFNLNNSADFDSNGEMKVRILHTSAGNISHTLSIDEINLVSTLSFNNDFLVYETKTATFSDDFLVYATKTATFVNDFGVWQTKTATFNNDFSVTLGYEIKTLTNNFYVIDLANFDPKDFYPKVIIVDDDEALHLGGGYYEKI